jgi:hypothetical protein
LTSLQSERLLQGLLRLVKRFGAFFLRSSHISELFALSAKPRIFRLFACANEIEMQSRWFRRTRGTTYRPSFGRCNIATRQETVLDSTARVPLGCTQQQSRVFAQPFKVGLQCLDEFGHPNAEARSWRFWFGVEKNVVQITKLLRRTGIAKRGWNRWNYSLSTPDRLFDFPNTYLGPSR